MASFPFYQVTEGEWTSDKCVEVLGLRIPAFCTSDPTLLADYISNFQTRPDDVFVVTYPKSGTTWMQEIVWQIHNEGAISEANILDRVPLLELGANPPERKTSAPLIEALPTPRLLKTHLTYNTIPKGANEGTQCKYVYVARNPKDVAVSYYHYMQTPMWKYKGPWDFFSKLFVDGDVSWGAWNDHVLDWWKHRDDPNVLFLKYEDLHKDLPGHVRRIAEFLNKSLSDELISRIAEQCTFSGMMKNYNSYSLEGFYSNFLRKGMVGDWKNYFTPEQNEAFEKQVLAKIEGSGLEFDYEI